jgi:prefoldin beta subunit
MTAEMDNTRLIGQAQAYQQQMQAYMMQKEQLSIQLMEINKAMEDLEKTKEAEVYRISGPVLIKTKKADATKDLKEKQDLIKMRLSQIEKKEKGIKDKVDDLREKLTKPAAGGGGAG